MRLPWATATPQTDAGQVDRPYHETLSELLWNAIAHRERAAQHMTQEVPLEALELAHLIVDKLEEHQAANIVVLDLSQITSFTDYFVICTAESDRQAKTLREIVAEDLKHDLAIRPLSVEGEAASGWVLLDYNTVIVHIFSPRARAFYRLEEFWKAAPVVLKIQ